MRGLGFRIFGLAAIAIGLIGLRWDALAGVWQPTPEFAEGNAAFPYAVAILFTLGGVAVQWSRTRRAGAILLAILYLFFAAMWVKRIILLPQIFATWSGCGEQLALALSAVLIALQARSAKAQRRTPLVEVLRVVFGLCVIGFGVSHFLNVPQTASMVPAWLPPGQKFWAILTGVADVAAGVAIVGLRHEVLALRLLTVMFASFNAFVWLPILMKAPADHIGWAGNATNLALTAAAWLWADALAARSFAPSRRTRQRRRGG